MSQQAYEDGQYVAVNGGSPWDCPYEEGSSRAIAWVRGFKAATGGPGVTRSLRDLWIDKLQAVLVGTMMPIEDALIEIGVLNLDTDEVDRLIRNLAKVGVRYDANQEKWVAK